MGQKLMGSAKAACGDAVISTGEDQSLLILIKHCQDMKHQETRLRGITFLLLLSCTALFVFTMYADLWTHQNSGSSGKRHTDKQPPVNAKQESLCPTAIPQPNFQRFHIHMRSIPADNRTDALYIKWDVEFGQMDVKDEHALVIPQTGVYFIYLGINLRCPDEDSDPVFKTFYAALRTSNVGYKKIRTIMENWDGVECTSEGFRTVSVGQLFDLLKGDHVMVWIGQGYDLIMKSSFGAYLA